MCMSVCICACTWGRAIPWSSSYISCLMWMLGIELGSLARTIDVLNFWAIFPALGQHNLYYSFLFMWVRVHRCGGVKRKSWVSFLRCCLLGSSWGKVLPSLKALLLAPGLSKYTNLNCLQQRHTRNENAMCSVQDGCCYRLWQGWFRIQLQGHWSMETVRNMETVGTWKQVESVFRDHHLQFFLFSILSPSGTVLVWNSNIFAKTVFQASPLRQWCFRKRLGRWGLGREGSDLINGFPV